MPNTIPHKPFNKSVYCGKNENYFLFRRTGHLIFYQKLLEMEIEFQNDDLQMEVLSRLPAKSVISFKCVSKEWLHLISYVSFRRLHSQRSRPAVSGFFFQERFQWCDDDIESLSYIPVESAQGGARYGVLDFLPEKVVLMASSSAFLCCRSLKSSHDPYIYICNPTCKEYIPVRWSVPKKIESIALVFDPFGRSVDISADFKLVSVHKTKVHMDLDLIDEEADTVSQFSFEIYSSKTDEWRSAKDTCLGNFSLFKNKGVFADGILYWLTDADKIISFNLENEKSLILDFPPVMQCKSVPEMCIGESEGCLHYIQISEVGLQDWVLKNYSESNWVLENFISLAQMAEEYPHFLYNLVERVASRMSTDVMPYLVPLAYRDGLLLMMVRSKIYSYNINSRNMEELCSLDCLGTNSVGSPIVLPYSLSMLPLECRNTVMVL